MQIVRNVQKGGHYDVVVAGSGPAGVTAAITLGRKGLNVLLVEASGSLGGCWTIAMMGITLDAGNKGGIPKEIASTLMRENKADWVDGNSYTYDIEAMKYVLDELVVSSGVHVLLYSQVNDVVVENGRIVSLLVDGPESFAISSEYVVDGTGNGKVAALAGCAYEEGYIDKSVMQPASLQALVTGVPSALWKSDIHNHTQKKNFQALLRKAGIDPSYPNPLLFSLGAGASTHAFQINHEYGVGVDNARTMSEATIHARKEIYEAAKALRNIEGWESLNLVATASHLGIRDGRRIQGLYRITSDDGINGRTFDDGVVPCSFCFDIHALDKHIASKTGSTKLTAKLKPYELPFRTMVSTDIANLFMVGRCICGDFEIHSSYRVMGNAASTGEAVGLAIASLSVGATNREANGVTLKKQMIELGYALSGCNNEVLV